ncbi:MAG: hypothetical protein AAFY60_17375, partial [Myxococcota bacterium]
MSRRSQDPSKVDLMSETGTISFVRAKPETEGKPRTGVTRPPKQKSFAQLKAEREALDQQMAREIAELAATPKGLRRARRWLDYAIVYGTAIFVAAIIYALATMLWPSQVGDNESAEVGVNETVDEEVGTMMDARRRLMKGQRRVRGDAA